MDIGHAVVDCSGCSHATAGHLWSRANLSTAASRRLRTRCQDPLEFPATEQLASSFYVRVRGDRTTVILPDDVAYEIRKAQRQAEAVEIYLDQQHSHPVNGRMLEHKIQALRHYIQYLEACQHDQEKTDQD
jgi:hypothetical protein